MSDPWSAIICEAAELKRKDLQQYDRFIAALQAYAGNQVTLMVAAEKDKLEVAQGRAQVILELTDRLKACFELEPKYRKRT